MNDNMHIDQAGLDLTAEAEGLRLEAYPDPATGGEPWTIGFGHTGPDVYEGMTITKEQAFDLLRQDIQSAEDAVKRLVKVPVTQGQFNALVDFAFNCGEGNLERSTLLRLLNNRDYWNADKEFIKWNKGAGKVLSGLTKRRMAEADMFDDQAPA